MASYSIIPTKQSDESPTTKHLIGGVAQPDDAFSRYLNDMLRFKSLLKMKTTTTMMTMTWTLLPPSTVLSAVWCP